MPWQPVSSNGYCVRAKGHPRQAWLPRAQQPGHPSWPISRLLSSPNAHESQSAYKEPTLSHLRVKPQTLPGGPHLSPPGPQPGISLPNTSGRYPQTHLLYARFRLASSSTHTAHTSGGTFSSSRRRIPPPGAMLSIRACQLSSVPLSTGASDALISDNVSLHVPTQHPEEKQPLIAIHKEMREASKIAWWSSARYPTR